MAHFNLETAVHRSPPLATAPCQDLQKQHARARPTAASGFNKTRGYAYLWLLLVVALMGLGLSMAAQLDATTAQRHAEKTLLSTGHQFRYAIGRYLETQNTAGKREYPPSLEALLRDSRTPDVRRYLRQIFVDPLTGQAQWGLVYLGGRIVGVHSLSEKPPIKQDNFSAEDSAFRGKTSYREWVFTYPPDLALQMANADPQDRSENPKTSPAP
jgi:hypothetical protein